MNFHFFEYFIIVVILIFCRACQPFDFSPYDIPSNPDENEKDLNKKNIEKISKIKQPDSDTFCFVVIADSHIEYSILENVVKQINKDKEILFVIHMGDMTDGGIYKEFHWTNDKMSKLKIPYIMIIGNHDYLANGKSIYKQMYGESFFTFSYNKTKFVCFDDVIWENNNTYPNFNWLKNNISDNGFYNHTFVLAHIPPFPDQFDDFCINTYNQILTSNNIELSLHGHIHGYSYSRYFENSDTWYFVADDIISHEYYKVYVTDSSFNIKTITF